MDLMAEFPDKYFDLAIVDPPYFKGPDRAAWYGRTTAYKPGQLRVPKNGYPSIKSWDVPGKEYFEELFRVSKEQIVWGVNYFDMPGIGPGRIVWDKVNGASNFSDCELAYCSSLKSVRIFRYMWNGMFQGSESAGTRACGDMSLREKRIHPTQKPVALYKWLIGKFARRGMKILDTHLGSGSIAIAAHYAGCDLVAAELDGNYFRKALERITLETKQLAFL